MDRSRLTAAISDLSFARSVADCTAPERPSADIVVVDLARFAAAVSELRTALPNARIVAFGPHVDEEAATAAREAGADVVLPRSRFFRDPAAATTV